MKLILGTDALHHPLTGIGWYVTELAQGLEKHSAITQLQFCNGRSITNINPSSASALSVNSESAPRSRPPRLPNLPFRPSIVRTVGSWYRGRCSKRLNSHKDWVCHAPNYVLPRSAVKDRNVVTVHDLSIFRYPHLHPQHRVKFMNHHLPRSVANAAKVIVASKSIAAEVIEHFGVNEQNINIIPFGVRSVFFSDSPVANNLPEALDGHPFMLFVNGADPRKNLADTVKAFALFAEKNKSEDWRLAVTGETSAMSEALQTQGVVALGYPTETELAQLYRSAQGLCYPSKYEGFGLPVIEALASGTTVLTSRTPTLLEFAGLPGVVIPDADSVDGLMSGMEALVSSKTKQQAAQNRVKAQLQFSWEKCVDRTVACYRELV